MYKTGGFLVLWGGHGQRTLDLICIGTLIFHIFVVNSILHDVLSSSAKDPIDIMVLDFKQMFDSKCLYECLNDVYEAGVDDDYFPLLYEAITGPWHVTRIQCARIDHRTLACYKDTMCKDR
jgi:hypothetical protein